MLATQHAKVKPYNAGYAPHSDAYDDTLMSKEEFFAKIDAALEEVRQGKGMVFNSKEELHAYFDAL
ncbi:MAG: hypothetical protein LBJ57_05615 [Prevotellaceae bacterium]|jgi:hypothetical protein|nr:hypothetical protein [Prevotellaceae bacterium]